MLTREEDIDVHALRRRGWTISAIARHLGRDRKTIRAYLAGREPGVRKPSRPDPFEKFEAYCRQRLDDDPHVWASTLFDEVLELGYEQSYPTFTRQLRTRRLRPACEPCVPAKGRPVAVIEHPPGEETQWDWVELPDPPEHWGWGKHAHLLVGALSHSGVWRAVLCESEEQPFLVDGLDRVARALGGLTRDWRFDRMSTVVSPSTGKVSASFAAVAKHYGVTVRPCPPRRGNRKGVVEKANHVAAQRFWRTLPDDVSVEEAQRRLDKWCSTRGDVRMRATADGRATVATLAAAEPLAPMPAPFPATLSVQRVVSAQALVSYAGNRYSVPPELHGRAVTVLVRLGATHLDIATLPTLGREAAPTIVARHRLAPAGSGATIRDEGHVTALSHAVLAAFSTEAPHRSKQRRPPSAEARAEADRLRASSSGLEQDQPVVIDLARYAAAAAGRNTLTTHQ
ncbi:IS21 family transposase [Intrasporangium calvum]|uniref:IS21 family transposase n=1 Tax=Intrasporangium calvum TaxID=53358 RepID=UPI000DF61F4D|nr:IS21 family transposase [Intrasporangium calvum]AXG14328.1 IS21 family transposase [Intrasporangium calvum]AXG14817.1 IS21 family transposase [Intrasporangium calvum]